MISNSYLYIGDILAVWIVIQIVTGKAMYRHTGVSRREDKRSFWALIGLESLIVIPMLCFQFHLDDIALIASLMILVPTSGFVLYIFWLLLGALMRPKWLWAQIRQDYEKDPKKFWKTLFLGR